MLRSSLVLVLLTALAGHLATPARAQDLDAVLDNYYEAVGGLDAWESLNTIKATGKMMIPSQGIEAPFTMMAKRPKKVRIEFTFQGMTGVQAYDGETAWMIMPFMGKTDPEPMPEDQAKEIVDEADIDGPLIGYEKEGHQLELLGKEAVEGTEAYKLKLTRKNGDVEYWFLDAEYYVPIKVEGTRTQRGQEVEYETTLSDYKEVGGLMMAHSIESKPKGAPSGQVIAIDSLAVNVAVGDDQFTMPKKQDKGQQ